ncbi:Myosin type-2 heavy chain 1 [Coemansia sp. RSA 1822]|nr:Myosin type-2 heavy chain 1 [Coemansia sp. RSA 1853]KAJ2558282.1 Myosin type-2 heavy chain 1 [Coemansia sp. RSA 1822]
MSEKRENLEPSQPQSECQDPSYEDGERGLFSSNHGPSLSQQQYPPQYQQQHPPQYQEPYIQHQQQQYNNYQDNLSNGEPAPSAEPIHLSLINLQRPNSGFSLAFPERLRALARSPIDQTKWLQFIQELNRVLAKAPGSVANGFADFWIIRLATLGTATHARNMYSDRVFNNAMELVEKYNQLVFAQSGLAARLKLQKSTEQDIDIMFDVCDLSNPAQIKKLLSIYAVSDYGNPIIGPVMNKVSRRASPTDKTDKMLLDSNDLSEQVLYLTARKVPAIETYIPPEFRTPRIRALVDSQTDMAYDEEDEAMGDHMDEYNDYDAFNQGVPAGNY